MDLLEHQGKAFFRMHEVPTAPPGETCRTPEEVGRAAAAIGGPVVVKAQVKTGGRGKAGGVKLADTPEEAARVAGDILGLDIDGHVVEIVYVEPASDIAEEYYLSVMHDRVGKGYTVICSAEGGVDIETVNRQNPEAVVKRSLTPSQVAGDGDGSGGSLDRDIAADIVTEASLPEEVRDQATELLVALFDAFRAGDALLVEINPLVRTADDRVVALDAKVSLDDNALFRHDDYEGWRDFDQSGEGPEAEAKRKGIQYVKLDGEVGILGNGAGLVMATLDVVAQHGGNPANFLDVGGGASADQMADSLGIVLSDREVKAVLINIYGGITRGEEIASGTLEALERLGDIEQRIVIRIDGTNAAQGRKILEEAGHPNIVAAASMDEAAEQAVKLATA